jgi:hypothetical protein
MTESLVIEIQLKCQLSHRKYPAERRAVIYTYITQAVPLVFKINFVMCFTQGQKPPSQWLRRGLFSPPNHTVIQTTLRHKFPVPVSTRGLPNSTS